MNTIEILNRALLRTERGCKSPEQALVLKMLRININKILNETTKEEVAAHYQALEDAQEYHGQG